MLQIRAHGILGDLTGLEHLSRPDDFARHEVTDLGELTHRRAHDEPREEGSEPRAVAPLGRRREADHGHATICVEETGPALGRLAGVMAFVPHEQAGRRSLLVPRHERLNRGDLHGGVRSRPSPRARRHGPDVEPEVLERRARLLHELGSVRQPQHAVASLDRLLHDRGADAGLSGSGGEHDHDTVPPRSHLAPGGIDRGLLIVAQVDRRRHGGRAIRVRHVDPRSGSLPRRPSRNDP